MTAPQGSLATSVVPETIPLADLSDVAAKTGTGDVVVVQTSPTIITPIIASFASATHNHQAAAGGGTLDHGLALGGLLDDDHTIYALLAGRAGGQSLIGGSAASENLTLQSTAHATKGKILFGSSGYDEANNRLGIGTQIPGDKLDVSGNVNVSAILKLAGSEFGRVVGSFFALNYAAELSGVSVSGSLGIGTTSPSASAILDATSTAKGFLAPRMTTAQRDAVASPATGLLIFNTSTIRFEHWDGDSWEPVATGAGSGTVGQLPKFDTSTTFADSIAKETTDGIEIVKSVALANTMLRLRNSTAKTFNGSTIFEGVEYISRAAGASADKELLRFLWGHDTITGGDYASAYSARCLIQTFSAPLAAWETAIGIARNKVGIGGMPSDVASGAELQVVGSIGSNRLRTPDAEMHSGGSIFWGAYSYSGASYLGQTVTGLGNISPAIAFVVSDVERIRMHTNGLSIANAANPTARVDIAGATTALASLRIRAGTAPTTPNVGDIWQDGANALKFYDGSGSRTFAFLDAGQTFSSFAVTGASTFDGLITFADGTNIALGTITGTKIGTATTQKLGFFNAAPIVQPSAYTQTYATADKTHADFTSADLSGITSSTTGSVLAEPSAAYTQSEMQQNFRRIQDQFNALRADVADAKQMINALVDDLQALGLAG